MLTTTLTVTKFNFIKVWILQSKNNSLKMFKMGIKSKYY